MKSYHVQTRVRAESQQPQHHNTVLAGAVSVGAALLAVVVMGGVF